MTNIKWFVFLIASFVFNIKVSSQKLMPGDVCPDVNLELVNYPKSYSKVSDFKGKPVILDFWTTYCIPCIASFPKLDSLQKKFGDKVKIILVTTEEKETTLKLLNRLKESRGIDLPSIINDKELTKLFPHQTIQHTVWINSDGQVHAITYPEEITDENVRSFVEGKSISASKTSEYQRSYLLKANVPLFNQENYELNTSNVESYSILTKYLDGVNGAIGSGGPGATSGRPFGKGINKIMFTNAAPILLFQFAYAYGLENQEYSLLYGPSRVRLMTRDSLHYRPGRNWSQEELKQWNKKFAIGYDLQVPLQDSSKIFQIMQKDLAIKFPVTASLEKEDVLCYVLVETGKNTKYQSTGRERYKEVNQFFIKYSNVPVAALMNDLFRFYQSGIHPLINEIKYSGKIDLEINADVSDYKKLSAELQKWGLDIKLEKRKLDFLTIRDK